MLTTFLDFVAKYPATLLVFLALYEAFWPGTMFFVTHKFEKRKVWLGKGQSRMFFPGDFTLGIGVTAFIGMHARNRVWAECYSAKYWIVSGIGFYILSLIIRAIDIKRYPKRSAWSPSKIAHDFCGYFVCFWLLASLGLPQILWTVKHPECFAKAQTEWRTFFVCAAIFIFCTVWDISHPATAEDLQKMHPEDWGRRTEET